MNARRLQLFYYGHITCVHCMTPFVNFMAVSFISTACCRLIVMAM